MAESDGESFKRRAKWAKGVGARAPRVWMSSGELQLFAGGEICGNGNVWVARKGTGLLVPQ